MIRRNLLPVFASMAVAVTGACSHPAPRSDRSVFPELPRPVGGSPDQPPTSAMVPTGAYLAERNRCVDRELERRGLNEYGDPPATQYPAGSPLVNSVTGTVADRHEYVLRHRRDIGTACTLPPGDLGSR